MRRDPNLENYSHRGSIEPLQEPLLLRYVLFRCPISLFYMLYQTLSLSLSINLSLCLSLSLFVVFGV